MNRTLTQLIYNLQKPEVFVAYGGGRRNSPLNSFHEYVFFKPMQSNLDSLFGRQVATLIFFFFVWGGGCVDNTSM